MFHCIAMWLHDVDLAVQLFTKEMKCSKIRPRAGSGAVSK